MLSIQLPPLEVFNATLLHELCLKYFSNLLWFTSRNRAYYTSWIHAWSLPQTVASEFILEICHNAFLLNLYFKCPTNHLPMFHLSSNIISKIRLEITHKLLPPCLISAQINPTKIMLKMSHKLYHPKPCMISPQFIPSKIMLEMSNKLYPLEPCLISSQFISSKIMLEMSH